MTTQEIAEFLSAELVGDRDTEILSAASLQDAGPRQITFTTAGGDINSSASCIIVPLDFSPSGQQSLISVADPKLAFALIAAKLHPPPRQSALRHHTASISDSAVVEARYIGAYVSIGAKSHIADDVEVGDGVRIGRSVRVGESTTIYPNCTIYDNVEIGANCVIHAGCVIGADGFGYVKDKAGEYQQFPQIGKVFIEDNVEIGANTCIDHGSLGDTRIGAGTKIDNLVQIAHNVQIGKRVVIAAQTGISGSTVIEDDCVIGGQVGMGDHARVQSGAVIGSQAGVLPGKIVRPGVWWGTPIQPLDQYKRQNAHMKGLAALKDDVRTLKKIVVELTRDK